MANYSQRYNATTQTTTAGAFKFDTISAVDWPVAKLIWGEEGATNYASAAAPLPVSAAATDALLTTIDTDTGAIATSVASIDTKTPALGQALAAASVPVVLTAAQVSTLTPPAAITGFATESTLGTLSAKFATGTVIGDVNLGATDNAVLDAIAASAAAIQAGQLPDSHNVTIDNASITVTGTFWQATQPVSGTVAVTGTQTDALTDTQLRATAVPVSGTVTAELSATDNAVLDAIAASVAGTLTVGSHAVTNAGTFAVQVTSAPTTAVTGTFWQATQPVSLASVPSHAVTVASGGVASGAVASGAFASGSIVAGAVAAGATSFVKLEDAASANADAGVPSMAVRKATPANTSGTDGDYEMLQMSAGRLWTSATIDAALPAGTNNIGDVDVLSLPALPTGTNSIGQVTVNGGNFATTSAAGTQPVQAIQLGYWDGASFAHISSSGGNGLPITSAGGATIPVSLDDFNISGLPVVGSVAHDTADSGNPIKTGSRAAGTLSNDTMVADADRVDSVGDLDGCLLVRPGFPLGDLISERVTDTSGTSTAFTNFGATASTRNYITAIVVYNSSATAGTIDFRDGTAGSVLYTVPIPATGGAVISNGGAPLFRTSANTALAYDVSGALTTVTISASGFKSKV